MNLFGTAVILAGGKSTRMPFDKQELHIGGKPIAVHIADQLSSEFPHVLINTRTPKLYEKYPYRLLQDLVLNAGPLGGIHAGLRHSDSRYTYFIGCDMPYVSLAYIRYLKGQLKEHPDSGGIVTLYQGMFEPLNSFYGNAALPMIEAQLKMEEYRLHRFFKGSKVLVVPEEKARAYSPDWKMFTNINTIEDLSSSFSLYPYVRSSAHS